MDINLIGSVNQLGYGLTTTNLLSELQKLGHRVSLFPMKHNGMQAHPKHHSVIQEALKNAQMPNFQAPCVRIWHQFDMSMFCGGKKYGFPIFELDEFNKIEKHHLSSVDEMIVCSEWAKTIILDQIPDKPVHVVPLGVDLDIFSHVGNTYSKERPVRFLAAGKWEYRKGHDVVLKAFTDTFLETDNVQLYCMTQNPVIPEDMNKDWNETFQYSKLGNKIKLIPRLETQEDVARIMREVDCGIFPARAEGWNLELLEMIATGKPSIATNYSGHTEFCNVDNTYLIEYETSEVAHDGYFFKNNIGNWMKITDNNMEYIKNKMRDIYESLSNPILNTGQSDISVSPRFAQQFTWQNSAKKLVNILQD